MTQSLLSVPSVNGKFALCTAVSPLVQPTHYYPIHANTAHVAGCLGSVTPSVSIQPVVFLVSSLSLFSSFFSPPFSLFLHFPIKATHRGVGSLCFVFEFAFNPAFYYRLACRLLTQTWLPLLKFTGYLIRSHFIQKRRVENIQLRREADRALKGRQGHITTEFRTGGLKLTTVCTVGKICILIL